VCSSDLIANVIATLILVRANVVAPHLATKSGHQKAAMLLDGCFAGHLRRLLAPIIQPNKVGANGQRTPSISLQFHTTAASQPHGVNCQNFQRGNNIMLLPSTSRTTRTNPCGPFVTAPMAHSSENAHPTNSHSLDTAPSSAKLNTGIE